jgi:hypothetical protein
LSQDEFAAATARFNDSEPMRTCAGCGDIHGVIDLATFAWPEVAEAIRAG